MVTESFERAARHLAEHHRKVGSAVGTRIGGAQMVLFEAWSDRGGGRVRVLHIRPPYLYVESCRRLAKAALGVEWMSGLEIYDAEAREAWFVVPVDPIALDSRTVERELRFPNFIRWYSGYELATGIGGNRGGHITFAGMSLELCNG